jgi:hypothetical protein
LHQAAKKSDLAKINEIKLEFSLNLNPFDQEDKGILTVIAALKACDNLDEKLTEFSERVALLLKHDWERAKHEAKPWFFRWHPPKRTPYTEFKSQQN